MRTELEVDRFWQRDDGDGSLKFTTQRLDALLQSADARLLTDQPPPFNAEGELIGMAVFRWA
jgi:hypothetical protein